MMSGYNSLIDEIEAIRSNVAIFRKVILHSHSTDSSDYDESVKSRGSKDNYINTEKEAFKIAKDRLDGGYILNGDAGIPDEAKPENLKALFDFAKKYGVYW